MSIGSAWSQTALADGTNVVTLQLKKPKVSWASASTCTFSYFSPASQGFGTLKEA